MKNINYEYLKEGSKMYGPPIYDGPGKLLYEYVRGSQSYGLATETSDIDRGGVYILPNDILLSMKQGTGTLGYEPQYSSKSHDEIWYEISRFFELVCECNPNIIESLFVDDAFVIYEDPVITELKKHRDELITKACFPKFGGYAVSQIHKARGLNKKIVQPVTKKKSPLDFVYTFCNQGSVKIGKWLDEHGIRQEFAGLVAIPNMHNTYGVYYDWAAHIDGELRNILCKYQEHELLLSEEQDILKKFEHTWNELSGNSVTDPVDLAILLQAERKNFSGIIGENSNELRLSSVPDANDKPVIHIVYNQEDYSKHSKDYADYKKWERERNPARYALNAGHEYDAKNMSHAFRLVSMCIEIARGESVKVFRKSDREFLLNIKNHAYDYDTLMKKLEVLKKEMDEACANSVLPDSVDKTHIIQNFYKN